MRDRRHDQIVQPLLLLRRKLSVVSSRQLALQLFELLDTDQDLELLGKMQVRMFGDDEIDRASILDLRALRARMPDPQHEEHECVGRQNGVGHPRMPLDDGVIASDRKKIMPGSRQFYRDLDPERRYSTVTLFARLRG